MPRAWSLNSLDPIDCSNSLVPGSHAYAPVRRRIGPASDTGEHNCENAANTSIAAPDCCQPDASRRRRPLIVSNQAQAAASRTLRTDDIPSGPPGEAAAPTRDRPLAIGTNSDDAAAAGTSAMPGHIELPYSRTEDDTEEDEDAAADDDDADGEDDDDADGDEDDEECNAVEGNAWPAK